MLDLNIYIYIIYINIYIYIFKCIHTVFIADSTIIQIEPSNQVTVESINDFFFSRFFFTRKITF